MRRDPQKMAITGLDQMIDRTTDVVGINHLIMLMIVIEIMIGITIPEIDLLVGEIMIVGMSLVGEINHMIATIPRVIDLDRGIGTIIKIDILIQETTEIIGGNQGTDHTTNMIVMQMEETNHRRSAMVEILMPTLLFVM